MWEHNSLKIEAYNPSLRLLVSKVYDFNKKFWLSTSLRLCPISTEAKYGSHYLLSLLNAPVILRVKGYNFVSKCFTSYTTIWVTRVVKSIDCLLSHVLNALKSHTVRIVAPIRIHHNSKNICKVRHS